MLYEWDDEKNKINQQKHKLSFETACFVFDDPNALSYPERVVDGEERYHAIGMIGGVAVVLVAYTYRDRGGNEVIRLISARKADRKERKLYEQASR
jgi:uncharacterized DUF497 family protein